jgi:hypothetical protein
MSVSVDEAKLSEFTSCHAGSGSDFPTLKR